MKNLSKDFDHFAKKAKRRKRLLIIGLSALTMLVLGAGTLVVTSYQLQKSGENAQKMTQIYNLIAQPNRVGISNGGGVNGTSGTLDTQFMKDIDGYKIPFGTQNVTYGAWGNDASNLAMPQTSFYNNGKYDVNGNRLGLFFTPGLDVTPSPDVKYGTAGVRATHEASTLTEMPQTLAEVYVTFDKPYTYAQIQALVPSNLAINWYWLGLTNKKVDASMLTNYIGINTATMPKSGATYQLETSAANANADIMEYPEYNWPDFVKCVKLAPQYFTDYSPIVESGGKGTFDVFKDAAKQISSEENLDNAKFSGVILTGKTKNLATLDAESWVFATNVGSTTPERPYITPAK
ncbi:MAG: anti-sigma factor [Streptococcaceae bacterium]|jgi:hypothetical protein|nr:anti-sigma factor [Streptococcaceae bacterium]